MNAGDKDTYLTLEGPCEGLFKSKGSKHFGYGFPSTLKRRSKVTLKPSENPTTPRGMWPTLG